MTTEEKIISITNLIGHFNSEDKYYKLLRDIDDDKVDYNQYMKTSPITCDIELKWLPKADFNGCVALLTMLLREDHFQDGSLARRQRMGSVDAILRKMVENLLPELSEEELYRFRQVEIYNETAIKGRLVRIGKKKFFYCMDGTVAEVKLAMLMRILTEFKNPQNISGNDGIWATEFQLPFLEPNYMMCLDGDTLAYIRGDILHIMDENAFNDFFVKYNSETYLTAKEFGDQCGISYSWVKTLCSEGRIPGAVKKGGQWAIPINAKLPSDLRKYNKRQKKRK